MSDRGGDDERGDEGDREGDNESRNAAETREAHQALHQGVSEPRLDSRHPAMRRRQVCMYIYLSIYIHTCIYI